MLKKIIGTTAAKGINAAMYMIIVLLSTNTFGTEGYGTLSLFLQAITINATLAGFIVHSLVYLTSRSQVYKLQLIAYLFSIVMAFVGTSILYLLTLIPTGLFMATVVVSILSCWFQTNQQLLMGLKLVKRFNFISILQVSMQFIIITTLIFGKIITSIDAYIYALGASYFIGFLPALTTIKRDKFEGGDGGYRYIAKEGSRYGTYSTLGNGAQFLNYRLSSYLVEIFCGRSTMGIYSAALQIAESIWLLCRSIAMLNLTEVASSGDTLKMRIKTTQLMRLSVALTLIAGATILIFPDSFFQFLLGEKFIGVKNIVLLLSLGIISFSIYSVLSAYLSGIGKVRINTTGSYIGLIITTIAGFTLIPIYNTTGAAIATSITHFIIMVYTVYRFKKHTSLTLREMFSISKDKKLIGSFITQFLNK